MGQVGSSGADETLTEYCTTTGKSCLRVSGNRCPLACPHTMGKQMVDSTRLLLQIVLDKHYDDTCFLKIICHHLTIRGLMDLGWPNYLLHKWDAECISNGFIRQRSHGIYHALVHAEDSDDDQG